jgi:glucose-6-phosphate isomerase
MCANLSKQKLWLRFQNWFFPFPKLGLSVDLSRMNAPDSFLVRMKVPLRRAFAAMKRLEGGAIANKDEKRQVGHYWLRNPALAPSRRIRRDIETTIAAIRRFTNRVHAGKLRGQRGRFRRILLIGIGGSALGPQFVSQALGQAKERMHIHFLDNTDPDGIDRTLSAIRHDLGRTLCIVISKSGGTKETSNCKFETKAAYERAGLRFSAHAVAITRLDKELAKEARREKWIRVFPMWEWVGGRTSEMSAVGLLPAALQGFDIDAMLEGAKTCDKFTRLTDFRKNPAAQLALMWYYSGDGNGNGSRNMIVLPYKDRLELFSKYLQQLVMESIGKGQDLQGKPTSQGLTVFGNKGSTDQHAYVQQLRDGINDFFVTFIEVLRDRDGKSLQVEPGVTSGDYLNGFLHGTRQALYERGRESITLTLNEVSAFSIGVLIALFERTVGLYSLLVNVNAYNQPGVEAGKIAATDLLKLQSRVLKFLHSKRCQARTAREIANALDVPDEAEAVFHICQHAAANPDHGIRMKGVGLRAKFY